MPGFPGRTHAFSRRSRILINWLAAALVAAAALFLLVRLLESKLAFFPASGEDATPADFGAPFEADYVTTVDGERLRVWSLPRGDARAAILYFHGNGGSLSVWAPILAGIQRQGYAVHALDYRGYGLSTGRPSERGLFRDVDAFVPWAAARAAAGTPLVYWGRSLGGAMAAYASTVRKPDGVVIESSFPDVRALLRGSPLALVAPLSSYRFATATFLASVDRPVLVLHGDADGIVPYGAGRALYDRLPGQKQFFTIRGGDHNDLTPADAGYWTAIDEFMASLRESSGR